VTSSSAKKWSSPGSFATSCSTLSIRRAVRSGPADGVPIEDLGVGGIPYDMTRRDLLEDNRDLLEFCATLLPG
jgi:hypothetical protein